MGEAEDPAHWNYWKREMHIYQSGLLHRLPEGLAAPRCYGVEEQPGNVIWLWLEDISDRYAGVWPLDRFGLAARHFGRFNGAYLQGRAGTAFPWLSVGLVRQWCDNIFSEDLLSAPGRGRPSLWDHPAVLRLYPPPDSNPVLHFLRDRKRFLAALDRVPQSLCHKDAYPTNLMARLGRGGMEETVAVDWAMAGLGPLGEELAQLALGALDRLPGATASEVDRLVFSGYLDGLRDSGWRGSARLVRFGYVTSAVLRTGLVLLWSLAEAFDRSRVAEQGSGRENAAADSDSLDAAVQAQRSAVRLVLNWAEEAYERLDRMP
jgi:hypothetical protein